MTEPTFGGFRAGEDPWTTHWRWTAVTNGSVLGELREMHRRETRAGAPTGMCQCGLSAPCPTAERIGAYTTALDSPCGCSHGADGSCPSQPDTEDGMAEPTSPAEREPMSNERLSVIRAEVTRPSKYALEADAKDLACELLTEVDRARAEVVVAWEFYEAAQVAFDAEYATNGQLRAQLAALGEPELQHRLIDVSGHARTPTERDLALHDQWLPEVRHEVRDVYPTAWRPAGVRDAADGP